MANDEDSILEMIQSKEREIAVREADARKHAAEFLERAEQAASTFLQEQRLLAEAEAAKLYQERLNEIQKAKEQMLISERERLSDLEKFFRSRFDVAVNQVLQWAWGMDEEEKIAHEVQVETKAYR